MPRPHRCALYPSFRICVHLLLGVCAAHAALCARVPLPLQPLGPRLPRGSGCQSLPGSGCQLRPSASLGWSQPPRAEPFAGRTVGGEEGERRRRGRGAGGRWRLEPGKKEGARGREEVAGAGRGGREGGSQLSARPAAAAAARRRLRVSRRGRPGWAGPGAPPAAAPARRAPGPPGAPHR